MRTAICGKGFEERREAEPKNGVVAKYAARAGLHMLLIGMAAWYISHGSLWQIVSIWIPGVSGSGRRPGLRLLVWDKMAPTDQLRRRSAFAADGWSVCGAIMVLHCISGAIRRYHSR